MKTLECLSDYLKQIKNTSDKPAREELINFVKISDRAYREWQSGSAFPNGLRLIKLFYFLELKGYRISELEELDDDTRNFGRLIAFNIVSLEEAQKELGYNSGQMFAALRGEHKTHPERRKLIETFSHVYDQELQKLPKPESKTKPTSTKEVPVTVNEVYLLLRGLDGLVSLLIPRLEKMLDDEFTPEERRKFREEMTPKFIFDLSNRFHKSNSLLNALCSEKARELNSR
jgi:hypothetical protein